MKSELSKIVKMISVADLNDDHLCKRIDRRIAKLKAAISPQWLSTDEVDWMINYKVDQIWDEHRCANATEKSSSNDDGEEDWEVFL